MIEASKTGVQCKCPALADGIINEMRSTITLKMEAARILFVVTKNMGGGYCQWIVDNRSNVY